MVFSLQTLKKISCGPVDDIAPGGMMSLAVALHSGVPPVEVKVPRAVYTALALASLATEPSLSSRREELNVKPNSQVILSTSKQDEGEWNTGHHHHHQHHRDTESNRKSHRFNGDLQAFSVPKVLRTV